MTVIIWRAPFFSSSIGAKICILPASFRILSALRRRIAGPYVSGRNRIAINEIPAMIRPTQKVHLQSTADTNPDIIGATTGPKVVLLVQSGCMQLQSRRILTDMKSAKARPLETGSL